MKKSRRKFMSKFKSKVTIEALKEQSILQELASKYEVHPNQISAWEKDLLDKIDSVFDSKPQLNKKKKKIIRNSLSL